MHSTRKSALLAFSAAGTLLAPLPALAASDYLLKLEGVEGEATTTIELQSWSWGASHAAPTGGAARTAHEATHVVQQSGGTLSVVTAREAGSGQATGRNRCATGKHYAKAQVVLRSATWLLDDVNVTQCAADGMTLTYRSAVEAAPVAREGKATKTRSNIQNN